MSGRPTAPIQPHELDGFKLNKPGSGSNDRTIEKLVARWDGQEVWANVDGMWRQATVFATAPGELPNSPWTFIIGTKHDIWRHTIVTHPVDATETEFELIHANEHVELPLKQSADGTFELIHSHEEDHVSIRGHDCPVHPYVAEYIRRQKETIASLKVANAKLTQDLAARDKEFQQTLSKFQEAALAAEKERQQNLADNRLPIALKEIENLRHELVQLNGKYEGKVAQVNDLNRDINTLSEKVRSLNWIIPAPNLNLIGNKFILIIGRSNSRRAGSSS